MRCGRVRLTLFFPLHISNFLYRIENVVCYPFRTANLVDNGTKEGQIGEGCPFIDDEPDIFEEGVLAIQPGEEVAIAYSYISTL